MHFTIYSKRLASAISREIGAAEAVDVLSRRKLRFLSPRNKSTARTSPQQVDVFCHSRLNFRKCRKCDVAYERFAVFREGIAGMLSNRSMEPKKALLSCKGHRVYTSAPSSRFTFSLLLVHLLLLLQVAGVRTGYRHRSAAVLPFSHRLVVASQVQRLSLYKFFNVTRSRGKNFSR